MQAEPASTQLTWEEQVEQGEAKVFALRPWGTEAEDTGSATALPTPATTHKPLLQPEHLADAARPFWQARYEDEYHIIPNLLARYDTFMSEDRAALNWMRFQRQDMSQFLMEWIERWRQHGHTPENILEMLLQMLQNLCRS